MRSQRDFLKTFSAFVYLGFLLVRSENNQQESIILLNLVGSGASAQVISLVGMCLYPLSYVVGLESPSFLYLLFLQVI